MTDQALQPGTAHNISAPAKPPPWNDPVIRSVVFQIVAIICIGGFFWYILDNTLTNMAKRGITTGFKFLNTEAGFGILMSLIEYDESHSYGRTFVVGLLNTVLVSFLGIILATIIGFIIGIARLSNNWLIAKIATVYIEVLRNIPLLLQIFFWYIAVLQTLPALRQSIMLGDSFFLNNRGFYMPRPVFGDGFEFVTAAMIIAIAAIVYFRRWAHKRQDETGHQYHVFYISLGILIGLPLVIFLAVG
ncbi:MAG: amino acid ABC transporter permease, partial [Rhodospirillaceae bacterium]|nr:amino acid ABC transporter permease [Rhodospirillaceae bacterium]